MSNFSWADYQTSTANNSATNGASSNQKVGFFKLLDDGDEALIRINCADINTLSFATVHTVSANGKWMKISCLAPVNSRTFDVCPLCGEAEKENASISKASKKVYVQMLASYKDKRSGEFSVAVPVIWERPAAFSRDLANLIKDYGDLRNLVFKVTRNGAKGYMKTTYALTFIPLYNKPEYVPVDFTAFDNFKISRHSFWEKTAEDINTFLKTGSFPEVNVNSSTVTINTTPAANINYVGNMNQAPTQPQYQQTPINSVPWEASPSVTNQPQMNTPTMSAPAMNTPAEPVNTQNTTRNFNGNFGYGNF